MKSLNTEQLQKTFCNAVKRITKSNLNAFRKKAKVLIWQEGEEFNLKGANPHVTAIPSNYLEDRENKTEYEKYKNTRVLVLVIGTRDFCKKFLAFADRDREGTQRWEKEFLEKLDNSRNRDIFWYTGNCEGEATIAPPKKVLVAA